MIRAFIRMGLVSLFAIFGQSPLLADEPKIKIVLVGDSTVADGSGWGPGFAKLLGPNAESINMAKSGHSSKSYYDKGFWKKVLEAKPDYVLIQFGHNDQPGKGPERETDAKTTYREYLSKYIDEARKTGIKPILVTSLTRRIFKPDGKIESSLIPYVEGMKAVAADKKVPLVDLHARSIEQMEKIGPEAAKAFGPPHPKDATKVDGTHLSAKGVELTAPLVVDELRKVEPGIKVFLRATEKN